MKLLLSILCFSSFIFADPPVALDGNYILDEDNMINIYLSATDSDGDLLTFSIVDNPLNGILDLSGAFVTYMPNMNFNGIDLFTFIANDGQSNSNGATITITINPINDAPYIDYIPDAIIEENMQYSYMVIAFDVDGDALNYAASISGNGIVYLENNELTIIPNDNFIGILDVVVLVSDGVATDTTQFTLTVISDECDEGYTEIEGECYYQFDLDVLQQFIDNSQEAVYPPPSDMLPIDLGVQEWENGRIVFLCYSYISESECYIYDYTLSGEIPPDIGNLVELRNLILGLTQLSGEIPNSIGNLVNLTELKIYRSEITGSIPTEIGNLVNLTDLYLRENQLSGEIPSGIWNLVNLDRLFLEYNQLTGEIPESFSNLVNLRYCNLKHNQLSGQIPSNIGNFENMIGLSLAHNQLSGIIPNSICNLVENTSSIYLYGNQLCPPYPECLSEEQLNGSWQTGGGEGDQQVTSECVECILGDVNNDSILDILDIISMINLILDGDYNECSDTNSDGELNILDIVILVNLIFSSP